MLTFIFEAFDGPWKGSPDPMEPEKHWEIFTVYRKSKLVMQEIYAHLRPHLAGDGAKGMAPLAEQSQQPG